ncbi:hypothetical protein BH11CYA1_BH11CYA1_23250 [soil metagenome]
MPFGKPTGWRGRFGRQATRIAYQENRFVSLANHGRLDFCERLGHGCYALSPLN